MASIKKTINSKGQTVYKVQVSNGRGRKVTRSWTPADGWSARTVERELLKFAANLENELSDKKILTRSETIEQRRVEEMERAKLKTVRDYGNNIFMEAKAASFSENARSSYQMMLNKHIYPAIGDFLLQDITPAMLSKFLLSLQKEGYSQATITKIYNIIRGLLKMAYLSDMIERNPCDKVSVPKQRKFSEETHEKEALAFTVEELNYILSCMDREPLKWRCYVYLLADTAMRRGEACGLQWSDIDFKEKNITIRRNLQYTADVGVYVDSPKNGRSRTVDIGDTVLRMLYQLREEQANTAISKWVFTQEGTSEPMHPQSPSRYFKKIGQRYGIEDFHPHKLRHTSASISLIHGADIASVSERLGHSDTAVTLRTYTHSNKESVRRAGQIVRDALEMNA